MLANAVLIPAPARSPRPCAPTSSPPAPVTATFAATSRAAVGIIAELKRQIGELEAALAELETHPDADIYRSLPGLLPHLINVTSSVSKRYCRAVYDSARSGEYAGAPSAAEGYEFDDCSKSTRQVPTPAQV